MYRHLPTFGQGFFTLAESYTYNQSYFALIKASLNCTRSKFKSFQTCSCFVLI